MHKLTSNDPMTFDPILSNPYIIGIADDTSSPWTRCIFRQIAQQNPAYGMAMTVCYGVTLCVYKRVNILPYFPFWMSYCSQTWSNCRRPQVTTAHVIHVPQGLPLGVAEGGKCPSKKVSITQKGKQFAFLHQLLQSNLVKL